MKKLFYLAAMLLLVVSCKSLPSQVEEFGLKGKTLCLSIDVL